MAELFIPRWMRGTPLAQIFEDAYIESAGNELLALDAVRDSEFYDQVFEGNKYEDGSLRYDEQDYMAVKESFENILLSVDLNPSLFSSKFAQLIQGNVSPAEFSTRVNSLYERVSSQSEAIRNYYDQEFGTELNTSGIMASLMDPDLGQSILNRQIAISEVGGSAFEHNINVQRDYAERLVQAGLDNREEASNFFGLAQGLLPTLSVLARRHADPDDDFDLEEFASSQIFNDPEQRRRMQRLIGQERSSFSQLAAGSLARSESGRLTGLAAE